MRHVTSWCRAFADDALLGVVDISTRDVGVTDAFRVYQQCCRRLRMTTGPGAVVASPASPRGTVGSSADDAAAPSLMTESSLRSAARSIAHSVEPIQGGSAAGAAAADRGPSPASTQPPVPADGDGPTTNALAPHSSDPCATSRHDAADGEGRHHDADNTGAATSALLSSNAVAAVSEDIVGAATVPGGVSDDRGGGDGQAAPAPASQQLAEAAPPDDASQSDGSDSALRVVTIRSHSLKKKKKTKKKQEFGCSGCNFTSQYAHVVRRHFLVHTGLRPYRCSHCDYSATQANNLAYHVSARHRTPSADEILAENLAASGVAQSWRLRLREKVEANPPATDSEGSSDGEWDSRQRTPSSVSAERRHHDDQPAGEWPSRPAPIDGAVGDAAAPSSSPDSDPAAVPSSVRRSHDGALAKRQRVGESAPPPATPFRVASAPVMPAPPVPVPLPVPAVFSKAASVSRHRASEQTLRAVPLAQSTAAAHASGSGAAASGLPLLEAPFAASAAAPPAFPAHWPGYHTDVPAAASSAAAMIRGYGAAGPGMHAPWSGGYFLQPQWGSGSYASLPMLGAQPSQMPGAVAAAGPWLPSFAGGPFQAPLWLLPSQPRLMRAGDLGGGWVPDPNPIVIAAPPWSAVNAAYSTRTTQDDAARASGDDDARD